MKVVLFCGGMGMRLREYSESVPKPMVNIGYRPILWHLMKYYAHFGHKDFVLCLGWKANVVKDYFLNYSECVSNDFVLESGGSVSLLGSDIHDWKITFVDTGLNANIGQRLKAVQPHVEDEDVFLANYTDGLTDLHLPALIDHFHATDSIATCLGVKPQQSFHLVSSDDQGRVTDVTPIAQSEMWMNGGFYVFRSSIFDHLHEGEELVEEPFERLIAQQQLTLYHYDGYFGCMDTFKEKQQLDDLHHGGHPPWEVWKRPTADAQSNGTGTRHRPPSNGTANGSPSNRRRA